MKKSYPIFALLILAWLFSSCGGSNGRVEIQPTAASTQPQILTPTTGVSLAPERSSATTLASPSDPVGITTDALAVAQALPVRGRSASTDYSRDAFGTAWKDVDRNGCDTRNDILQRDFLTSIFKSGTGNCKVIGGTWIDPYSNESYTFSEPPSGAQIDHVVSLKNAWEMGADQWDNQMRTEFANDPLNLRVTIASLNQQKSDSNAASWLPPYKPGRCDFIATQVAVKAKWQLFVTESEKEVFITILSKPECETTQLPN